MKKDEQKTKKKKKEPINSQQILKFAPEVPLAVNIYKDKIMKTPIMDFTIMLFYKFSERTNMSVYEGYKKAKSLSSIVNR